MDSILFVVFSWRYRIFGVDYCIVLFLSGNSTTWCRIEMATAQRTRAVGGPPCHAAWQLKSALRHSVSAAPRTIIFYIFLQLLLVGCQNSEGGHISSRIIWLYPPQIVWVWSTSASPPIIWLWCASERRCPLEFEEKKCSIVGEAPLFFGLHLNFEKKVFHFWWRPFLWSSLNLLTWTKLWSRFISPNVENRPKLG